jgi:hypothetical protein
LYHFPDKAKEIVDQLLEQDGEFLIKTGRTGDKPVNGFSKAKVQLIGCLVSQIGSSMTFAEPLQRTSQNLGLIGSYSKGL